MFEVGRPRTAGLENRIAPVHRVAPVVAAVKGLFTVHRPTADAHSRQLRGELKIIAVILEAPVIEKFLMHLGLQARAPPQAPARGQALQAA